MITLTESAARKVRELEQENASEGQFMRILVKSGGCSGLEYGMTFDGRKEDDIVIDTDGVKVLVDPRSLERMDGSVVDFDDGLHGKGFEIRNPLAQSTCGCGRSFS